MGCHKNTYKTKKDAIKTTMNKNYEKIRQACIKANPKLLELSFGCWVDVGEGVPHYVRVLRQLKSNVYRYDQHTKRKYEGIQNIIEFLDNFNCDRTPLGEIKEILGHEPQLSDVLLVIEKLYWNNEFANEVGYDWYVRQLLKRYNLANPLKDQSEETLEYITNLYEELQKIASLHNPL